MGTVFGKGNRNRGKPAESNGRPAGSTGKAGPEDKSSEWSARQEELRRALVRNGASTGTYGLSGLRPAPPVHPTADATGNPAATSGRNTTRSNPAREPLDGRSFAEVFTTESLFDKDSPSVAVHGRPAAASAARSATHKPKATAPRPKDRPRIPSNHPAMVALEALGLDGNATWADVQRNYRALAKKAHPDFSHDSGEAMSAINGYYRQLRSAQSYGLFDSAE